MTTEKNTSNRLAFWWERQAQIWGRPNPQVAVGCVDSQVPLILCDLTLDDQPIVYASESFMCLTEYTWPEIRGRNCRFLQAPGGKVKARSVRKHVDKETVRKMRKAVDKRTELQIEVVNFKKSGQPFVNVLTMIPIMVDGRPHCVGFQCEKE